MLEASNSFSVSVSGDNSFFVILEASLQIVFLQKFTVGASMQH